MTSPGQSEGDRSRDEVLAGEYVLGVLSQENRALVEARMRRDRPFAAIVHRWEQNLSTLNDEYEVVAPPNLMLPLLEAKLFAAQDRQRRAGNAVLGSWWTSLPLWRGVAFASIFLLAGTLFFTLEQRLGAGSASAPLVAELAPQAGTTATALNLVALYEQSSGRLTLTPVAAGPAEEHSLELWLIKGNDPAVSLGILPQDGAGAVTVPETMRRQIGEGVTLAVSLEPYGGSPTGAATGPVLAVGKTRAR